MIMVKGDSRELELFCYDKVFALPMKLYIVTWKVNHIIYKHILQILETARLKAKTKYNWYAILREKGIP